MSPPTLPATSPATTPPNKRRQLATHLRHRLYEHGRVRCPVGRVISSHQAPTAMQLHSLGQGLVTEAALSLAGRSWVILVARLLSNLISASARSQESSLVFLDAIFCIQSMLFTTKPLTFRNGTQQKEASRTIPSTQI